MRARRWTQVAGVLAANPWFAYFFTRRIYQGKAKGLCFPGFNCYACPLALFSCPIGALQQSFTLMSPRIRSASAPQAALSAVKRSASYPLGAMLYVVGFIGLVGILTGRLVCGWLCPFGFLQDLLYKIPTPKLPLPQWMRFGKYFALVVVAMIIPYITGIHWYSRLCPAGALEGALPLKVLSPEAPLPDTGWFFWLKIAILVGFLVWMVLTKRPFCRAACALGGAYALLTPVSLYRMSVDSAKCTKCGDCRAVCPVDINIWENGNSPECVRCLDCKKGCPEGAVSSGFGLKITGEKGAGRQASPGSR
jgi:ferredoxin-type protein NapH